MEKNYYGNNTVEGLQAYIAELSVYINENNEKYNRNMQVLK
jgi:hypothetical protein